MMQTLINTLTDLYNIYDAEHDTKILMQYVNTVMHKGELIHLQGM